MSLNDLPSRELAVDTMRRQHELVGTAVPKILRALYSDLDNDVERAAAYQVAGMIAQAQAEEGGTLEGALRLFEAKHAEREREIENDVDEFLASQEWQELQGAEQTGAAPDARRRKGAPRSWAPVGAVSSAAWGPPVNVILRLVPVGEGERDFEVRCQECVP